MIKIFSGKHIAEVQAEAQAALKGHEITQIHAAFDSHNRLVLVVVYE